MQRVQPNGTEPPNGAPLNGTNGVHGHPHPPAPHLMPPMPAPPPAEQEGGLDFPAIWNAFRRRWFLAVGLGLLLGIPAAIGLWVAAPAPYVTFAEIRLNSLNPQAFPGTKGTPIPDFHVWKQAVLKRATHPLVLTEALRPPEVSGTALIREQEPHPIPWLEKNVSVGASGTEYLRIQLEGENPQELAAIVNSISQSLVQDVDGDLYNERTNKKKNLDVLITEKTRIIQGKTQEMDNLKSALKVDPAEIERRQSYLVALGASLRSALISIEVEKLKFRGQQQPAGQKTGGEIAALIEPQILGDPKYQQADEEVQRHLNKLKAQETYLEQALERLPQNHPRVIEGQEKLTRLKAEKDILFQDLQNVREALQKDILAGLPKDAAGTGDPEEWFKNYQQVFEKAFAKNEQELKAELEQVKAEQQDLDRYSLQGDRLKHDIERVQKQLEQLQDENNRLKFEIENAPVLIEISRKAEIPHERSLRKKIMLSGGGGLALFGFFVAGIVFLEYRTQRIGTLNQLSEKLNLRVMGTVPLLPRSAASGNAKHKAKNALWYTP